MPSLMMDNDSQTPIFIVPPDPSGFLRRSFYPGQDREPLNTGLQPRKIFIDGSPCFN